MALPFDIATVSIFIHQIEGPYKWYIIGGVIIFITIIVSRIVFKTLKWLLLLGLLAILAFGILHYLGYL